jgi:hypothetical protein
VQVRGELAGAGAEALCVMVTERVRSSPQDCCLYSACLHSQITFTITDKCERTCTDNDVLQ